MLPETFAVLLCPGGEESCALRIAEKLSVPLVREQAEIASDALHLCVRPEGVSLEQDKLEMRGNFEELLPRLKYNNLYGELLVKASRIKGLNRPVRVFDATAGMGEDSFLLAAAGCDVTLYEQDPVICTLLEDALRRALEHPGLREAASRMHLTEGDSIAAMKSIATAPDVVYLDPMFPERQKSALIKKKFQLLQQLERPCSDEQDLFQAAKQANPSRIVIKRPLKGPLLAGVRPSFTMEGKAVRYDCVILRTAE